MTSKCFDYKELKGSFCPLDASKDNPYFIIYETVNILNNKEYIGFHTLTRHADDYIGSGITLQRSIKKYGRNNFRFRILYAFKSRQEALNVESRIVNQEYVERHDTYNMQTGGKSGFSPNTEVRSRISISLKGKLAGEKNPMHGRVGEKNPRYGKSHSIEARKKISEGNKGKIRSENTLLKLRQAKIGRKLSDEHRKKMAISRTGERNGNFNPEIYVWKHTGGEIKVCSYNEMRKTYGSGIDAIKNGRREMAYGWKFLGKNE